MAVQTGPTTEYIWPMDMLDAAGVIDLEDIEISFEAEKSRLFQEKMDNPPFPVYNEMGVEGLCTDHEKGE